jgi:membrane-bound metal-dependent hydrolase YbcI (DUF457 family)
MAGFKTHLLGGMAGGGVLALSGYFQGHVNLKETGAVAVLGTLGGLLPDLDSDTGKPLKLLFQLLSILVPMSFYYLFKEFFTGEVTTTLLFFVISYLAIQYLLCPLIKKLTVHRGIMHSIPFALLCGQVTFLLFLKIPHRVAFYYAAAVFLGAMIHLILDEYYAISFKGFVPQLGRFSGTALAFYSSSLMTTLFIYLLLFATGYLILGGSIDLPLNKLIVFLQRFNFNFNLSWL